MDGGIVQTADWEGLKHEAASKCLGLKWWALNLTRDPFKAEELVQDTALKAIKHIESFEPWQIVRDDRS